MKSPSLNCLTLNPALKTRKHLQKVKFKYQNPIFVTWLAGIWVGEQVKIPLAKPSQVQNMYGKIGYMSDVSTINCPNHLSYRRCMEKSLREAGLATCSQQM